MNEDQEDGGQRWRITVGLVGAFLLFFWWRVDIAEDALEKSSKTGPNAASIEFATKKLERLEEIFRTIGATFLIFGGEAVVIAIRRRSHRRKQSRLDRLFAKLPAKGRVPDALPTLITADIDACITPTARGIVDLRNLQKIRQYARFVRLNRGYPPFILVSARSQEYTELMCQTLDLINPEKDIPCVVEIGMALYWPYKRVVKELAADKKDLMEKVGDVLRAALGKDYEFEPKQYMITVNVERQRATYEHAKDFMPKRRAEVQALREKIDELLRNQTDFAKSDLAVTATDNAVDIVPAGIDKLSGLKAVLNEMGEDDLKRVASIGNSEADLSLLADVGQPFCSSDAPPFVRELIVSRYPSPPVGDPTSKRAEGPVIYAADAAAVAQVISRVTGVRFN